MDVAFSPDNKRVATTSNDGTARIWDAETGNELVRLRFNFVSHKKGSIYESNLAFSPDGGMLATANSENTVGVWDVKTGEELFCLSNNGLIKSVAFSPDGKMIASASSDNTCRIFDIQKEEQSSPVCAISFGQDCSWITARIDGNTSVIRNVWAGKDLLRLNYNPENNIISFSPNGKRVAISNMVDVSIWNIENGKELLHLAATNNISYGEFVGFSFDGNMIAAYCTRHNKSYTTQDVEIWNTEKGKRVFDLKLPTLNPIGPWRQIIALSPDGKKAATAFGVLNSPKSDNLSIWDVETGKELVQLIFPGPVFNVAFSPDDTRIAVSCGSIAMILDASTWKIVSQLNHDALINHIAFSPDGNRVATASDDGSARIWNAETGVEIFRLEHANRVYDVVFSPDGTHVSTLAVNFTSKIWSLSSDDLICEACSRLTYNLTTMEWMKEYCGSCLGSTIK